MTFMGKLFYTHPYIIVLGDI